MRKFKMTILCSVQVEVLAELTEDGTFVRHVVGVKHPTAEEVMAALETHPGVGGLEELDSHYANAKDFQ